MAWNTRVQHFIPAYAWFFIIVYETSSLHTLFLHVIGKLWNFKKCKIVNARTVKLWKLLHCMCLALFYERDLMNFSICFQIGGGGLTSAFFGWA
jgi:hypothetical protein